MILAVCGVARGDGKFFSIERVPVGVPYQRAILMYEGGKETLILQSQYEIGKSKTAPTLAWIVPVPAVPELASMEAIIAEEFFRDVDFASRPYEIDLRLLLVLAVVLTLMGIVIAKAVILFSGFFRPLPADIKARAQQTMIDCLIVLFVIVFLASITMSSLGSGGGVELVKAETVGIYDVKVIRGQNGAAIMGWLKENGFGYNVAQEKTLDEYAMRGWCFVTAKVNTSTDPNLPEVISRGLPSPLILRFEAKDAVYPMALTATSGGNTEVLLYVFSEHKMECGARLEMRFAGKSIRADEDYLTGSVVPDGFFSKGAFARLYLSKFKGKMTSEQMREDIIFRPAKDDTPYKAWAVGW